MISVDRDFSPRGKGVFAESINFSRKCMLGYCENIVITVASAECYWIL